MRPVADGWVHKHDGIRLQIHARGKWVSLYTLTGVDWTLTATRGSWRTWGAWDTPSSMLSTSAMAKRVLPISNGSWRAL